MKIKLIALLIIVFTGSLSLYIAQENNSNCSPSRFSSQWSNTNFCNSSVNFEEIVSGGPPKDGIPAISQPAMETIEEASTWLVDQSPVIAVAIDGEARAYPQALLIWHEIVNDEISNVPIAVTFCPLCNSSIVFDRRIDNDILDFGVSGLLRNSDMIMYDRQTESWWQQFTGEAIVGTYNGRLLDILSSQILGFKQFVERYPNGLVMSQETGYRRAYGANPYLDYDGSRQPFLFFNEVDNRLPATERVLAGHLNNLPMAYPFAILSEEIVINDDIGETPVVAFWQPGVASALDEAVIDNSRDIGTAALYERIILGDSPLEFYWDETAFVIRDAQTQSAWNFFGEAVDGELLGTQLEMKLFAPHFWFAWAAFSPDTEIYQGNE